MLDRSFSSFSGHLSESAMNGMCGEREREREREREKRENKVTHTPGPLLSLLELFPAAAA